MQDIWHRYFGHISIATLTALAGLFIVTAFLTTELTFTVANEPQYVVLSEAPAISAESYLIFDLATGETIAAKDADTTRPIASVTKLMTAAAAGHVLSLDATTTVSAADVATEGRAGKLEAGDVYTVRELRIPLLLESSNDAAATLERVSNGALISHMNELSESFGSDAAFADASGLSDRNTASANGLAALLVGLSRTTPQVFDITNLSQYIGEYTGWGNNSPVREQDGYQGGKHGFTNAAGRTFAGIFEESSLESRSIGYVVLGSDDLTSDVSVLREFVSTEVERR